jgi:hypothetical protein
MVALLLHSQRLADLIFMLHEAEANQYLSAMNVPVKPFIEAFNRPGGMGRGA